MKRPVKSNYFEGREGPPGLIELYYQRLGDVDRILDLGCGTGWMGNISDSKNIEIVGVDIDIGALNEAQKREDHVVRIDLEFGSLPFLDEQFDGIIAKDILEHLIRPGPIVKELHRVLKPGGHVVISVPMAKPSVVYNDYTHIRGFTENALKTLFRDYGFEIRFIAPMGGVPGFGRLDLTHWLPIVLQIPLIRRFAVSHEMVVQKPEKKDR